MPNSNHSPQTAGKQLTKYIATALRYAIEDAKMRPVEVARGSGLSPAYIGKILQAQAQPSVDALIRIAAVFECRLEDFLPSQEVAR